MSDVEMGQSAESDGAPWPAEDTLTLCEAALMGDADAITDWLVEHITSERLEWMIISALAQWCAVVIPQFMPKGDADLYALQVLRDDADPQDLGVTQMIAAALNDDEDALHGHVEALFEQPREYRATVLFKLLAAFRDFGAIARERNTSPGGSDE